MDFYIDILLHLYWNISNNLNQYCGFIIIKKKIPALIEILLPPKHIKFSGQTLQSASFIFNENFPFGHLKQLIILYLIYFI